MAPAFLRPLLRLAPPRLRQAALGAVMDVRSLPARLADPARRAEPLAMLHNVGDGDFAAVGAQLLRNLEDHADLTPADAVLDIGCGTGRVAVQLAPFLAGRGTYVGFDISKAGVAACRRRFRGVAHLGFEHLDVRNGEYNPGGKVAELAAVFPVDDEAVDLAFATSVFTHMRLGSVRRYLVEAARVLKPGGRLAFTAFALEPGRERSALFDFQPFDATSRVVDHRYPERAIGHDRQALSGAVAEAGLSLRGFWKGAWAPPAEYQGGQDLFVAVKPGR